MTNETRDSGISIDADNDNDSSSDCAKLSYVQRLKKRFELLAKAEKEPEFHTECNWWLDDEVTVNDDDDDNDSEPISATNSSVKYTNQLSAQSEKYSQQSSVQTLKYSPQASVQSLKYSQQSSVHSARYSQQSSVKSLLEAPNVTEECPIIELSHDDDDDDVNDINDDDKDSFESADESELLRPHSDPPATRPVSIMSHQSTKLMNIIRELLDIEESYVRTLRDGIDKYMKPMDSTDVPKALRGQKFRIFGNIASIYDFHNSEFLPQLMQCSDDPERIADVFNRFVTRDYFYGYVIYAINRKRSELLCNYHGDFFKKIQNERHDKLGINSFLLQPIQRLPRYQLLLNEIIKDLTKDLDTHKPAIAACCVAEKNIQRLLDTVNESMSINDIRNCYEIDVLCQGKFRKASEFDIYDWDLRRRFRGKVFLFERCLIYTESLDREYLEYRGHYDSDRLGIIYKEGKSKFKLFARRAGQKEVAFHTDMQTILEWKDIITGMLMEFAEEEKKRNVFNTLRRKKSTLRARLLPDSVRSSMVSTTSDQSNFSISSYQSSSGNSSERASLESRQSRLSRWYI